MHSFKQMEKELELLDKKFADKVIKKFESTLKI